MEALVIFAAGVFSAKLVLKDKKKYFTTGYTKSHVLLIKKAFFYWYFGINKF